MEENTKNPEIVLDALTESPKKFSKFELKPLTISKYAWLERLHSPFIDSSIEFSVDTVVPTLFVLASDRGTLKKVGRDIEDVKEAAFEWADENLEIKEVPEAIKAVVAMFTAMNKAAPTASSGSDDPKKN